MVILYIFILFAFFIYFILFRFHSVPRWKHYYVSPALYGLDHDLYEVLCSSIRLVLNDIMDQKKKNDLNKTEDNVGYFAVVCGMQLN